MFQIGTPAQVVGEGFGRAVVGLTVKFVLVADVCTSCLLLGVDVEEAVGVAIVVVNVVVGISGPLGPAADEAVVAAARSVTRCCGDRVGAAVATLSDLNSSLVFNVKELPADSSAVLSSR